MRKLNILKTLIDLAFFLSIIGLFGVIIFATMFAIDSEGEIPIKLQGQELTSDLPGAKIVIAFAAISYLLFVYVLFCCVKQSRSLKNATFSTFKTFAISTLSESA